MPKLLQQVGNILETKGHCVVCVAEGAGQDICDDGRTAATDASGNPILKDVGTYLRDEFKAHFKVRAW